MNLVARVHQHFALSADANRQSADGLSPAIALAAEVMYNALLAEHKVLICGNGGSAAEAQHFSAELVNRFEVERPGLAAVALTTDTSILTSIANDFAFEQVYSRQVRALGQPADILVAITTSGQSRNILDAIDAAHAREMTVILLTGRDGGEATGRLGDEDVAIVVADESTARIQEIHLLAIHCICDLIDHQLLGFEE